MFTIIMYRLKKHFQTNGAFTLLEVMVAIAIMVLALGAILSVQQGSIKAAERAKQMNIVHLLAKNFLIETEFELSTMSFQEASLEKKGTFKTPFEDYTYSRNVKEVNIPNFAKLLNSDNSTEQSDMLNLMVSKYLNQSLREVTISIYWKKGDKPQSYSVSYYWVNLTNEVSFGQ